LPASRSRLDVLNPRPTDSVFILSTGPCGLDASDITSDCGWVCKGSSRKSLSSNERSEPFLPVKLVLFKWCRSGVSAEISGTGRETFEGDDLQNAALCQPENAISVTLLRHTTHSLLYGRLVRSYSSAGITELRIRYDSAGGDQICQS
jgi:hypothetical protein